MNNIYKRLIQHYNNISNEKQTKTDVYFIFLHIKSRTVQNIVKSHNVNVTHKLSQILKPLCTKLKSKISKNKNT